MTHLPGHPFFQVLFPRRIVRIGFAPYLLPPKHLDSGCFHQPDWPAFAFAVKDHSREYPGALAPVVEVFLLDPLPTLFGMTPPAPPPELPEDAVVHFREDAFTHCKTVVHGPALDLLIQTPDHLARRHAP